MNVPFLHTAPGAIIETNCGRFYRVAGTFNEGTHLDCIEVKRIAGGFADKKNARRRLVLPAFILRTVQ